MESNLDPSICRDFLRNVCNRAPLCHDYLNGACSRMNCKFLHITPTNENNPILVQHYDKNTDQNIPFCKDFLKGLCRRGALCKFRHILAKDKNSQRISNSQNQSHQQVTQIMHQPVGSLNPIQSQTTIMPLAASCNGQQLYIQVENQNSQSSNGQNSMIQSNSVPQSPSSFQQYPNSGTFYAAVSGAPHQIHHLTASMPSAIVDSRLITTTLPGIPVVMASNQPHQTSSHNTIISSESDRLTNVIDRIPSVSGTAAAAMAAASVFVQSSTHNSENDEGNLLNTDTINQLMPSIVNSAVAGANAFAQQGNSSSELSTKLSIESAIQLSKQDFESKDKMVKNSCISKTFFHTDSKEIGDASLSDPTEDIKFPSQSCIFDSTNSKFDKIESKQFLMKEKNSESLDISKTPNSINQLRSSMAMTAAAVAAVAAAAAVEHHHMKQQNQHSVSSGPIMLQSQMSCPSDTLATRTSSSSSISAPGLLPSIVPISSHTSVSHTNLPLTTSSQHTQIQTNQPQQQMTFIRNRQNPIISTVISPISENQPGQSVCFLPVQAIPSNTQSVLVTSNNSSVASQSDSSIPNPRIDTNQNSSNRANHDNSEDRTEALIRLSEARLNRKIRHVELLNLLSQTSSSATDFIEAVSESTSKKSKLESVNFSVSEEIINPEDSINNSENILHDILLNQRKKMFRRKHLRSYIDDYESEEMSLSEEYEPLGSPEWHGVQKKLDSEKDGNKYSSEDDNNVKVESSPLNKSPIIDSSQINCDSLDKTETRIQEPPTTSKVVHSPQFKVKKSKRNSLLAILDSLKNSLKDNENLRSLNILRKHTTMLKSENKKLRMKVNSLGRQNSELWTHNKILLDQNIRLRESSKQVVAASRATESAAAAVEAHVNQNSSSICAPSHSNSYSKSENCYFTAKTR